MEHSIAASAQGLVAIDQARKRLGWNRQSTAWAQQALTSVATLKQFWRRERVSRDTFMRICEAVGEKNWEAIGECASPMPAEILTLIDWGEAPEAMEFRGRETELATLQTWLLEERCKLISILGMGGMGKTTLTVRLAEQMRSHFTHILWRSLRNAPPLLDLGTQFLQSLNPLQDGGITLDLLLQTLRDRRCLLILDNVESILSTHVGEGIFQPGYEDYGDLFRRVGEERHQSCLVLTSREVPREIVRLAGEKVRSLPLLGLPATVGTEILQSLGGLAPGDYSEIIHHYAGNPLALKIVATGIRDVLNQDVATFIDLLHQGSCLFSDIQDLLARHCDRLSHPEQEVLTGLSIAREPMTVERLQELLLSPESKFNLSATLESLKRRSLLEVTLMGYTLQPAVMEYVIHRFLERATEELTGLLRSAEEGLIEERLIEECSTLQLRHHPLLMANAKDFVRDAQRRLLIEPVIAHLQALFDTETELYTALLKQLQRLKEKPVQRVGYLGGTLFNLLTQLKLEWLETDLSHLVLWQADLRPAKLYSVNLTGSDLSQSSLIDLFGVVLSVTCHGEQPIVAYSDDRGWVHLWQTSTGQQLQSFQAHQHWIFSVAFSPDGTAIACGSLDRTVSLWDWQTGTRLQTFAFHTEGIGAIAFHPQATATQGILASSGSDPTIQIMDLQTGTRKIALMGHQGIVPTIEFSPDGQWLASGSWDQTIKIWDTKTWTCAQTWECETPVHAIAFLPNDLQNTDLERPWIAIAGENSEINILNYKTGESVNILSGHRDQVWSLALSQEGYLISGSDDCTVRLWDWVTGDCLKMLQGHQGRIWSVAGSRQGEIVSGGADQTVRLWMGQSHDCIYTLRGYHNATAPVAMGDRELFTFSADQVLRRWILEAPNAVQTFCLPTKNSMKAAMHPRLTQVACAGLDGRVQLYDLNNGTVIAALQGHQTWVRDLAFSPDGTELASASGDRTIKLWDCATATCLHTLEGHQSPVQAIAFHPNGKWLVSGSWDQQIRLWDLETATCLQTLTQHGDRIMSLNFTQDGKQLFSGDADGLVLRWEISENHKKQPVRSPQSLMHLSTGIVAIALHPTQNYLASLSQDNQLRLWDRQTGTCQKTHFVAIAYSSQLMFSPKGDWLAVGTDESTCLLLKSAMILQTETEISPEMQYIYRIPRPYEKTMIHQVLGLTAAQRSVFQTLGAIEAIAPVQIPPV
jgi:WD40 repeat protein